MSRARFLLRRFAWTLVVTWVVLTATFVMVAAPPDPNSAAVGFAVAQGGDAEAAREAIEQYQAARGLDRPLLERYLAFMTDTLTLQWGESFTYGTPVVELVGERAAVTATYLVPAMLVSTVGGLAIGLWTSVTDSGVVDRLATWLSYAGFGVPAFYVGLLLLGLFGEVFGFTGGLEAGFSAGERLDVPGDLLDAQNLTYLLFPTVAMSVTLLAAQVRYVRSELREYLREDFVKLVRSAGADRWVVARHVLRNAAVPLVAVLFTELLASLALSVFVIEAALEVPGLGDLAFTAIQQRDVPVVVVSVLVPVLVGVVGNFLQDLSYAVLDPRVEAN